MDRTRHLVKENLSHLKRKQKQQISNRSMENTHPTENTNLSNMMVGRGIEVMKRSGLQKPSSSRDFSYREPIHKRQNNLLLQDDELNIQETMHSFSPHPRHVRRPFSGVTVEDENEEECLEEEREIDSDSNSETDTMDPQPDENISSTSHGTTFTRKESRGLKQTKTRKSRIKEGKLLFEFDEFSRRIVGDDSQFFITAGGCLMREHAKFDGTTWKNQPPLLKTDIINKIMENSSYDPNCSTMERVMQTQLGNQHKNKQWRLHCYYDTFPTKEDALTHPPKGIKVHDWVLLCERFASEEFQKVSAKNKKNRSFNKVPPAVGTVSIARIVDMKRREGHEVSAIERYKIAHFSKKKNKMINEEAENTLKELQSEEATSSCTAAEICLKKLKHIPGYVKGRSTSTKHVLAIENLRMELESEKKRSTALEERSTALEERVQGFQQEQSQFHEAQNYMKEEMKFLREELARLSRLQSQKTGTQDQLRRR